MWICENMANIFLSTCDDSKLKNLLLNCVLLKTNEAKMLVPLGRNVKSCDF